MPQLTLPTIDPHPSPPVPVRAPVGRPEDRTVQILGVEIIDVTQRRAVELVRHMIDSSDGRTHQIFFVNAHTLNLAAANPDYRALLNTGSSVFGDGTGVRWAARMKGVDVRDNLNGTDFVPKLLESTPGRRYFLLGADADTILRAAAVAEMRFPNWTQTGFHHGFLCDSQLDANVVRLINAAQPDVLLVGMGNPHQERWIYEHRAALSVPVCVGVGGLFDFWAGNVTRAPRWLRHLGQEWIWRLLQQPGEKARRYLLGNPLFLRRAWADRK